MKPVKKTSKPAPITAKPVKPATPAKPIKAAAVKPTVTVKPATVAKSAAAKVPATGPAKPATVKTAVAEPTHEAIALRAYLIWEKNGRQSGRDAENWREAIAQLKAES